MGKLKNFTIPKDEQPKYYSTTVENGEIVRHDGDPDHAVYTSEMREIQRRANLWHKWVEKNVPDAYGEWGVIKPEVMTEYHHINRQFMDGERSE